MKKAIKIIAICLLGLLGVAFVVFYIINPTLAKEYVAYVVDFVNKPLPIVGVTTLAVLIFLWRVIVTIKYGKGAIKKYEEKCAEMQTKYDEALKQITDYYEKSLALEQSAKQNVIDLCKLFPNKKVQNFGKEIEELTYGKETIDSDTKEE